MNVTHRAEFSPATDESGRAIAGSYEVSVRWQLPERNADALEPFNVIHSFTVQGDGTITDCTTQRTGSVPTQIADCPPDFAFEPAVDEDGNPVTKKVRMYFGLEFEDANNLTDGQINLPSLFALVMLRRFLTAFALITGLAALGAPAHAVENLGERLKLALRLRLPARPKPMLLKALRTTRLIRKRMTVPTRQSSCVPRRF